MPHIMTDDTIPADAITSAPPPWKTKATMYLIPFWTSSKTDKLPAKAYHPLESQSAFASREFGIPRGGLSMLHLIRYHETPVGPYDELVFCPGSFENPVEGKDGKKTTKKALRITRIYVSQKHTCWNGRRNWNLPKHLARFEWTDDPVNGTTHVEVFPHDTHQPYDPTEPPPDITRTTPFFQCTIHLRKHNPLRFFPSFPVSTILLEKLGMDLTLVQPPLPEGAQASQGELPGTEEWVALAGVRQYARHGKLAWGDFRQQLQEQQEGEEEGGEKFWPGLGRSWLVVKLDRGGAEFPEGRKWPTPRYLL